MKKEAGLWNKDETVSTAIKTLQTVISTDFKSNEIEVAYSSVMNPRFVKLSEQEIDAILTKMHDTV